MKNAQKMMNAVTFRTLLALCICSALLMGCKKDKTDEPMPSKNIVQVVTEIPEFSTLVAALNKTGVDLNDTKNFIFSTSTNRAITLFAPTNAAFMGLSAPFTDAKSISAITDAEQIEKLRAILYYHVVGQKVNVADLASGDSKLINFTGKELKNITVSKTNEGVLLNGKAKVVTPDIQASNGVIHAIDQVLLP
jgi:uncharacterized surface protein with fasciclin (FAS1) repeats